MFISINDKLTRAADRAISPLDRGFAFGDGVFETLRISHAQPFLWSDHFRRFRAGARFLQIPLRNTSASLRHTLDRLIARNAMPNAIARITLTRGPGPRGYAPPKHPRPTLAVSLHPSEPAQPVPPPRRLFTSAIRLYAADPLLRHKTCNRLPFILAAAEAQAAGADDALLLNHRGEVVETSNANLFWIEKQTVHTPPLSCGALPGVTRQYVLKLCQRLGVPCRQSVAAPDRLTRADGLFVTLSTLGIVGIAAIDSRSIRESKVTAALQDALWRRLRR